MRTKSDGFRLVMDGLSFVCSLNLGIAAIVMIIVFIDGIGLRFTLDT